MQRSLPFRVAFAVAGVAALAQAAAADPPPANAKTNGTFPSRVLSLTEVVLQHHIDPPTRQQMILDGTKAVYRAAREPVPQSTGRRVSGLSNDAQLTGFLKELQTRFANQRQTDEVFLNALLASLPGGARLISGEELRVQGQLNANRYVGTGVVLNVNRDARRPAIPKPFYNGPAWKAGAKAGDLILEIDGQSTEKMALRDVVRLLRGEKGTVVVLKVRQPDSKDVRSLKITRDVAFIPTVEGHREIAEGRWQFRLDADPNVAYVRLNSIGSSTLHELRQVAARLGGKEIRGIVLDLRYGGGTLHDIVMVADALLDGGAIGRVRTGDDVKSYTSGRGALFARLPMAVLIDRTASSGREFLAAALQDNRRAVIVGEPTAGDGFVRSHVRIPGSDGAVVMATGELQRGDGTSLRASRPLPVGSVPPPANGRKPRKAGPGRVVPDLVVAISDPQRTKLMRSSSYTIPGLKKPADDPLLAKAVAVLKADRNKGGRRKAAAP